MSKLSLTNLVNLQNENTAVTAINANNAAIVTAMNNALFRNGTSPNQMTATLDMNSNRIINLPQASTNTEPVRLGDFDNVLAELQAGLDVISAGTSADQTTVNFPTRTSVQGTSISALVSYLRTAGYTTAGDGGHGLYKRVVSQPSHAAKIQSLDGAWWELVPGDVIYWNQLGAKGDNVTNDRDAIQSAHDTAIAMGVQKCLGYPGTYRTLSSINLNSASPLKFGGAGKLRTIIQPVGAIFALNCSLTALTAQSSTLELADFTINAAVGHVAGDGATAILISYRGDVKINNIRIGDRSTSSFDYGVDLAFHSPSFRMWNCDIFKCEAFGIRTSGGINDFSGHNMFLQCNEFYGNGVGLSGAAVLLLSALDVSILCNDWADNYVCVSLNNCDSITISGNQMETSPGQTLKFVSNLSLNVRVTGNLIGQSTSAQAWALWGTGILEHNDLYDTNTLQLGPEVIVGQNSFALSSAISQTFHTVATLPAASTSKGWRRMVTNATATTFMSTVVGGGANTVPVISDGTNWKIG